MRGTPHERPEVFFEQYVPINYLALEAKLLYISNGV